MSAARWDPRNLVVDDKPSHTFVAALVAVYALITLFVAVHHEAWRDEADGWLFARDGSLAGLLNYTRHGGTPALWLITLMPLAKAGLPYFSQTLLHIAIAMTSIAIVAWYAPLSRLTKTLLAFSYFLSYEYAIIARSYALSVLLIVIAAALCERRHEHPIAFAIVVALL